MELYTCCVNSQVALKRESSRDAWEGCRLNATGNGHHLVSWNITNVPFPKIEIRHPSKDRQNIRRTRHPTRNIAHLTRDEEAPPLLLLALLSKRLQVEELTNGTSPSR